MSVQKASKILLNNNSYYFVEEVKQVCPAFFYGCAKTSRMIVDKKKINNTEYIYATYAPKSLKWKLSDETVKSAKILLSCNWVEQNVPNWKTEDGIVTNEQKLDLEVVPSLLELNDKEKFKDDKGNIYDQETEEPVGTFNFSQNKWTNYKESVNSVYENAMKLYIKSDHLNMVRYLEHHMDLLGDKKYLNLRRVILEKVQQI